jgi:hypothetical protein
MSIDFHKVNRRVVLALLLMSLMGCTASLTPTSSVDIQMMPTAKRSSDAPIPTPPPTESPVEVITPSPTVKTIVITANNGNLNIRRGPGVSYNPIAILKNGQSAIAHGRDLLANWLMVDIPGLAGETGWVRTETEYSIITGDVNSLPEVVVDFAVPAYVQNCTYHMMVLDPGGILVSGLLSFPDNDARVYPGEYTVYDDDVTDSPEVMTFSVKEGALISIDVDGNSERHKCP